MRGEYSISDAELLERLELPPRARRIPKIIGPQRKRLGTTSACAENTLGFIGDDGVYRNYLRVRGEYPVVGHAVGCRLELPPRARRIPGHTSMEALNNGTTSACAENTCSSLRLRGLYWNYLRVRGEYPPHHPTGSGYRELPPRARRIRRVRGLWGLLGGTTSACAENTKFTLRRLQLLRNYLRVRGEYTTSGPVRRILL